MNFKDFDKGVAELDATNNNIAPNFIELLRMESSKNFEQPKKNKLLFYFAGTIKNLKNKLTKKL